MNVLVAVAGIADPKRALGRVGLAPDGACIQHEAGARILSPFDESALELALRLRDSNPATQITVLALGGSQDEPLLRRLLAYRPARLLRVDPATLVEHDLQHVATALGQCEELRDIVTDLVLVGRTFGDFDDGSFAPFLATAYGQECLELIHDVACIDGGYRLLRRHMGAEEWVEAIQPVVASVTNERRNRLRHPLMKNVMLAKREELPRALGCTAPRTWLHLTAAAVAPPVRRERAGTIFTGAPDETARQLAAWLERWCATK